MTKIEPYCIPDPATDRCVQCRCRNISEQGHRECPAYEMWQEHVEKEIEKYSSQVVN
jgi:hypothetical protein